MTWIIRLQIGKPAEFKITWNQSLKYAPIGEEPFPPLGRELILSFQDQTKNGIGLYMVKY